MRSTSDKCTFSIDFLLATANIAPLIKRSTSWLTDVKASINSVGGGVEASIPVATANIVGRPDKSTIGGMLTSSGYLDGPAFSLGIYPVIDSPASGVVAEARGVEGRIVDGVAMMPEDETPSKAVALANILGMDTTGSNTNTAEGRSAKRTGSARGGLSWCSSIWLRI